MCCGIEFFSISGNKQNGKGRKFCSKECKMQSFDRFNAWTDEEIGLFEHLSSLMPKHQIPYEFRKIAESKQWLKRSHVAVSHKLHTLELDYSLSTSRKYYTTTELAQILNINISRINCKWRQNGLEFAFYRSTRVNSISIYTLKKYAANRPRDFYGIQVSKLNIIFRDMAFSKEIFELAFGDSFSRCFYIVRLEGGVYESVGDASKRLDIGQSTIEQAIKRESGINTTPQHAHRGEPYNFIKLNYPRYLAPDGYEKEFNELAGSILIELYREYQKIQGYSKLGIHVVAVRQAVNIALVSFRAYFTDKSNGVVKNTVEVIAEYWQKRCIKVFMWHLQVDNFTISRRRIFNNLKQRAYRIFVGVYGASADSYFGEYADEFISSYSEAYFKDQYLPTRYPQNKYVASDIWVFVECLSLCVLRKNRKLSLAMAKAINFVKRRQPQSNYNPDWIDHNYHSENEEASSEIDVIIEGLDMLNLEPSYKQMCNDYVQAFCKHGDAYQVREELKISKEMEQQIMQTLKLATAPF